MELKKHKLCLFVLSLFWIFSCSRHSPSLDLQTFTDDLGRKHAISFPLKRVVVLAPSYAEFIALLGELDRVVGVSNQCQHPPEIIKKTRVGNAIQPSIEKIVRLKPQAVLSFHSRPNPHLEDLEKMKIAVIYFHPTRLQDIEEIILKLGKLLGVEKKAQKARKIFHQQLQTVTRQALIFQGETVYFEIWDQPLRAITPNSILGEIIAKMGLRNIIESSQPGNVIVNEEFVIRKNPDWIIVSGREEETLWRIQNRPGWKEISAIKKNQIVVLPPEHPLFSQGPRLTEGIADLIQRMKALR